MRVLQSSCQGRPLLGVRGETGRWVSSPAQGWQGHEQAGLCWEPGIPGAEQGKAILRCKAESCGFRLHLRLLNRLLTKDQMQKSSEGPGGALGGCRFTVFFCEMCSIAAVCDHCRSAESQAGQGEQTLEEPTRLPLHHVLHPEHPEPVGGRGSLASLGSSQGLLLGLGADVLQQWDFCTQL